jgi:hypothetical protein
MSFLGLGQGGDVVVSWPVFKTPALRPRVSQRCSETPLREASDEVERWTGMLTRLARGPARESLARRSL